MTDNQFTRRAFIVTGGAASLFLLAPAAMRNAAAATSTSLVSVGFVNTLKPLVLGARVVPGANVWNDASLVNRLVQVSVGGVHPSTDTAFPAATLDGVFARDGKNYPFYAFTHRGGVARGGVNYDIVPGSGGLRFRLGGASGSVPAVLGGGQGNGLRAGTYLFGLGSNTWARAATLANNPIQRSVIVVVRPAT